MSSPVASRWCPLRTQVSVGPWGSLGRDRRWGQGQTMLPGLLSGSWAAAKPSQAFPHPTVKRVLDAEGLALGSVIATSKKARRDLIDDSFNRYWGLQSVPQQGHMNWGPHVLLTAQLGPSRYSYNEEEGELPEWFTEEERQHRRRQLPVDKATVEAYRQRWKEINARPIKKVAEAKARKKRRVSGDELPGVP